MVELKEPLATLWRDKDAFTEAKDLQGDIFRALETRRTLRFQLANRSYFIKLHFGTTLKEVLKNLIVFRLPVLGADREWKAIHRLKEQGIDTMTGIAFGQRGVNPLRRESFIITEDLMPTVSLEDYCRDWTYLPPKPATKRMLIKRVATMVSQMHQAGINHRDCYICHFLLHLPFDAKEENLKISIIDLHRAQIRQHIPLRWRDKDLIGLYFSSMKIGLTQRDIFRFLITYFSLPLHQILQQESSLLEKATIKAEKIRARTVRKHL